IQHRKKEAAAGQVRAIETDAGEISYAQVLVGQDRVGRAGIDDLPDQLRLGVDDRVRVQFHLFKSRKIEIRAIKVRCAKIGARQIRVKKTSCLEIAKTAVRAGKIAGIKNGL